MDNMYETSNDYTFKEFIDTRDALSDWDNPFLLELFKEYLKENYEPAIKKIQPFVNEVSSNFRFTAREISRPENTPTLRHYNAYNERIDLIIRPRLGEEMTEWVFNKGLFSVENYNYEGIIKRFLLHSNGELGVTCPVACTDGLIAVIEEYKDDVHPEALKIYEHCKEGVNGDFGIGAQYITEIQGGSNIPANVLKAVAKDDHHLIYGNKFFCSATHADYIILTAVVDGTNDISVFVVPTWLPEDRKSKKRNGHRVNRLKWKLGTTELPSGEIDFDGAVAYAIGPQGKGVELTVRVVLTRSRLAIGFSSAGFLMRAAREAVLYSRFREVFDRRVDEFPMAAAQIQQLVNAAKKMSITAFEVYERYLNGLENPKSLSSFGTREVILLQKIFSSQKATEQLKVAISLFGGNGVIEDFSDIPRLYRDSVVNELWEGPKNVLLTQIYNDIRRKKATHSTLEILSAIFTQLDQGILEHNSKVIDEIIDIDLSGKPTQENMDASRRWETLWMELYESYENHLLEGYEEYSILEQKLLDKF